MASCSCDLRSIRFNSACGIISRATLSRALSKSLLAASARGRAMLRRPAVMATVFESGIDWYHASRASRTARSSRCVAMLSAMAACLFADAAMLALIRRSTDRRSSSRRSMLLSRSSSSNSVMRSPFFTYEPSGWRYRSRALCMGVTTASAFAAKAVTLMSTECLSSRSWIFSAMPDCAATAIVSANCICSVERIMVRPPGREGRYRLRQDHE